MKFIGRKAEMAVLEREYRRDGGFVVLYGRRRVGKTTLIKEFIQDKRALYFLASQETELLNRRRFATEVAAFTGQPLFAEASFDDWRPLFKAFADAPGPEKKVLVIDELPYLVQTNAAFPSVLQYAWDELLRDANVMLVLCGSSVHMMHDIALSHASPLYGRRTAQIKLLPLRFSEMREGFPQYGYRRAVELYALTGGVPKYFDFFANEDPLWQSIEENALSTSGFLYEEPKFLLEQEIRDPVNYLSILTAVSRGNRKLSEITKVLERRSGEVTPYIKLLVELGYLERRVPFDVEAPERSKQGLYYIADQYLSFWFNYVQPFAGELELGNTKPSLEKLEKTFRSSFVPFAFEKVSRQEFGDLCATGDIAFTPSRIGSYWNRRGTVELDVCAWSSTEGRAFLGECKFFDHRPVGIDVLSELEEKSTLVPLTTDALPLLGLFSATGYTDEVLARAQEDERLVLVNEGQVVE